MYSLLQGTRYCYLGILRDRDHAALVVGLLRARVRVGVGSRVKVRNGTGAW